MLRMKLTKAAPHLCFARPRLEKISLTLFVTLDSFEIVATLLWGFDKLKPLLDYATDHEVCSLPHVQRKCKKRQRREISPLLP